MSGSTRIIDLVVVPTFLPLNSATRADLIAMMRSFPVEHKLEIYFDTPSKLPPQKVASMLYPDMS